MQDWVSEYRYAIFLLHPFGMISISF
jgi:hypothetical protein